MSASANKRHSILPPLKDAGPKAPVRFSSTAIIADSAILTGTHTITLRTESLVHPRAKLDAALGPVDVGKRAIMHERTHVGAAPASAADVGSASSGTGGVTLGDYVTVQACAVVEAGGTVVGEGSVVGVGALVGRGAVIGDVCTLLHDSSPFPSSTSAVFVDEECVFVVACSTAPLLRELSSRPVPKSLTTWSYSHRTTNGATSAMSRISARDCKCGSWRYCRG